MLRLPYSEELGEAFAFTLMALVHYERRPEEVINAETKIRELALLSSPSGAWNRMWSVTSLTCLSKISSLTRQPGSGGGEI